MVETLVITRNKQTMVTFSKGILKNVVCLILVGHTLFACAPAKKLQQSNSTTQADPIWVVAHRANTGEGKYPENSLQMIQSCIDHGLQILELDIRETKDKQLVILHDKTVDRTTTGKGLLTDYSLIDLRKLKLTHQGQPTNQLVPTLEEVLVLAKGKAKLDLDIKLESQDAYERIVNLVKKYKMEKEVLFFLYDIQDIPRVHQLAPDMDILARVHNQQEIKQVQQYPFIQYIHIDEECYDAETMKTLLAKGYHVWLNSLGTYDALEKAGKNGFDQFLKKYPHVNIIQTDYGLQLIDFLHQQGKQGSK